MHSKKISVLGVQIDQINRQEAQNKAEEFFDEGGQHMIVTPNPEMLVLAQKNVQFKSALNSADVSICDGKGIEYLTGGKLKRLSGVDFMQDLCALAAKKQKRVFLLGTGNQAVLDKAKKQLEKYYPNIQIVGSHPGISIQLNHTGIQLDDAKNKQILKEVAQSEPDILFVAFGHGKQELWMQQYVQELPSVNIVMGIGGSLEFISQTLPRAPKWMQNMGLEWLFRLIQEPKRIKRIWTAVVVFPITYIFQSK